MKAKELTIDPTLAVAAEAIRSMQSIHDHAEPPEAA
jgi:hypothetical protein